MLNWDGEEELMNCSDLRLGFCILLKGDWWERKRRGVGWCGVGVDWVSIVWEFVLVGRVRVLMGIDCVK